MIVDDYEDEDDFDGASSLSNNVFMEIQSTVAFKEVDIDKLLQTTTLDEFLRGLYNNQGG